MSSLEFVQIDSNSTTQELEVVMEERFWVRFIITRAAGTAGATETAGVGTTGTAGAGGYNEAYLLSANR